MKSGQVAAICGLMMILSSAASGAWGLKFEVWDGANWVQSVGVTAGTSKVINFRFGAYFDADSPPQIVTADGVGTAMAFAQFTGSNEAVNFGYQDRFQNITRTVTSGNAALILNSGSTIGTMNANSFGRQLFLASVPFEPYKEIYRGEVRVSDDWTARDITLRNRTFGAGANAGLTFYNSASPVNKQAAMPSDAGGRIDIQAKIIVSGDNKCPADFVRDGIVEDADFQFFIELYNVGGCVLIEPYACRADLNHDWVVDDDDFLIFVYSYNRVICPT